MSTFQQYVTQGLSWVKNQLNKGKALIKHHQKAFIITASLLGVVVASSAIGYTYYQSNVQTIYHVYFHGQKIGTVNDPDIIYDWVGGKLQAESSKYDHVELQKDDNITFEEESLYKPAYDHELALNNLEKQFSLKASAVEVTIDGEFIGYVADEETLSTILDALKSEYVSQESIAQNEEEQPKEKDRKKPTLAIASFGEEEDLSAAANTTSDVASLELDQWQTLEAKIQEDISVQSISVHPSEVMSKEKLEEYLTSTKEEEKVYAVQSGDVLGVIAQNHDLSLAELLEMNPDINEESVLQIDQEIVVKAQEPLVSVVTVDKIKREVNIPYEVKRETTSDLYRGERRTKQEGKNGSKIVVYEVTKVNGNKINQNVLEEEIIEEPIEEIVLVGTKVKPSRGSGKFKWPAVGGKITSGYGMRWNRPHNGIDISGVSNRNILAADNGTVTKAEYNSSYGNYIVIDHGNGYSTLYAHLSSMSVSKGKVVKQGEKIGVMGTTGRSTGIHLHFEVHKNGSPVNPRNYVSP